MKTMRWFLVWLLRPVIDELRRQHEQEIDTNAIAMAKRMLTEDEMIERKNEYMRQKSDATTLRH